MLRMFLVVQTHKNASNDLFIGRKWLFKQLDDLFQGNDKISGAIFVGDLGSGKSTAIRQLVNSPENSSRFVHENIIASYFCEHDYPETRDGEVFVKSLVEQLSENVKRFGALVWDNKDILYTLHKCKDDPIGCAKVALLEPLNALKVPSNIKKFILIDSLDECCESDENHSSVIMKILSGLNIRLPRWVKLVVSSRNETTIITKMQEIGVETIAIQARNENNVEDIRCYVRERILRNDFRKKNEESMKNELNLTLY